MDPVSILVAWFLLPLSADLPDPALPGPFRIGVRTVEIIDESRAGRKLTTEIWYPTLDSTGQPANYPSRIPSEALRDARPAPGSFPIVLFSHGMSAVREGSIFWTEHLATHGYVVAAPDHQYNSSRDFRPLEVNQSAIDRPRDLRVVIDHLLVRSLDPADPLFRKLRHDQIAVSGQSLGAYTALAVAGAWVEGKEAPKRNGQPHPDYFDFTDPRVRAVIAFVPFFQPAFSPPGLSHVTVPTLIVGGTEDRVTPFAVNQKPIYEHLSGPKYLALIEGASHFNFNNDEMLAEAAFFVRSMHNPTLPREVLDARINRLTLAFLDRHLLGLNRYARYLSPGEPGVSVVAQNAFLPSAAPTLQISGNHTQMRCDFLLRRKGR